MCNKEIDSSKDVRKSKKAKTTDKLIGMNRRCKNQYID